MDRQEALQWGILLVALGVSVFVLFTIAKIVLAIAMLGALVIDLMMGVPT